MSHAGGPWSNLTGVLVRDQDTGTQRVGREDTGRKPRGLRRGPPCPHLKLGLQPQDWERLHSAETNAEHVTKPKHRGGEEKPRVSGGPGAAPRVRASPHAGQRPLPRETSPRTLRRSPAGRCLATEAPKRGRRQSAAPCWVLENVNAEGPCAVISGGVGRVWGREGAWLSPREEEV